MENESKILKAESKFGEDPNGTFWAGFGIFSIGYSLGYRPVTSVLGVFFMAFGLSMMTAAGMVKASEG